MSARRDREYKVACYAITEEFRVGLITIKECLARMKTVYVEVYAQGPTHEVALAFSAHASHEAAAQSGCFNCCHRLPLETLADCGCAPGSGQYSMRCTACGMLTFHDLLTAFAVRDVNGHQRGHFATREAAQAYLDNPPAHMAHLFTPTARIVEVAA